MEPFSAIENVAVPASADGLRKVSRALAIGTGALALITLTLGWGAGVDFFVRIRPGFPAMVPSTALCLLLGALGLIGLLYPKYKLIASIGGVVIPTVVATKYLIPTFDVSDDSMSIGTAIVCFLVAARLFMRSSPTRENSLTLIPETLGLSIVFVPILGYIFNADALFSNPVYTEMALHTAVGFAALFIGFLMCDARIGWMRVMSGPGLGSQMLRKLLPIIIVGPIVLTGLALLGTRKEYLSPDLRTAVLAYAMIFVTMTAAVYFAHLTNLSDQRAAEAERLRRESDRGRQAAELALERGQKVEALGKLVGGVAHDFNNMLSVILGNLQLLQIDRDEQAHSGYVADALDSVEHAAKLTRQLLAYGRKSQLEPVPAILDELVPKTLTMFERLCPANIAVTTQLSTPDTVVHIDPANFQQALLNILINARDAQRDGGDIHISTSLQELDREVVSGFGSPEQLFRGRFVIVAVRDGGAGMSKQELTRATEPFFTTKPFGEGTGLGLSVASGFCRQSGGGLTLSCDPGQGLTVTMAFPASDQELSHLKRDGAPKIQDAVSTHKILLVDDDPKITSVMARQLRLDGNHVVVAMNAAEALAILDAGDVPELVITDLVMPGAMQGHALAKEIRTRFPSTHVIMMSGYDSFRQHRNKLGAWEEPFLQKPINWVVLREVTTSVLSRPAGDN